MKLFLERRVRGPFAAMVLVVFFGAGCAAGLRQPAAGQAPAGVEDRMEPPVPNASAPGNAVAVLNEELAVPEVGVVRLSPSSQMLQSAGRNPHAVQPEKGFTLLVPETVWTGEPFLVRLGGRGLRQVSITWRDSTLTLPAVSGEGIPVCEAALAVPLDAKTRALPLTITAQWDSRTEILEARIPVRARSYPVESLKVASKYVTPPPELAERIKHDRAVLGAALSEVTPEKYWTVPMERPVPGGIGSVYGLRRIFNGQPRNAHKGLDFRAAAGDPVRSAEAGVVALARDQYYGGNTVVVDHGLGVFTLYLHLSAFTVSPGQRVARGDVVGFIGSTGRSTGPHLHFSLSVLRDSVNPAPFLKK